jgi:hypothetical protein
MRVAAVAHLSPVHLAILRTAGLLVPGERRAEWLAEWQAELWYASEECSRKNTSLLFNRGPITAFCFGSFKDALWLRRNAQRSGEPRASRLESPMRCIGFLAALAALSATTAFLLCLETQALVSTPDFNSQCLFLFLFIFLFPLPVLPSITSPPLGELQGDDKGPSWKLRLRRWTFLSAKVALILLMMFCGLVILGCGGIPFIPKVLQMNGLLGSYVFAFRWAINDQRERCPVCLRLLANPISLGGGSSCFLEPNCMGFMCPSGHGFLYVPESRTSWFSRQRWLTLGASWRNVSGE